MEQFNKYFSFNGRAARAEYWAVTLVVIALCVLSLGLTEALGGVSAVLGLFFSVVTVIVSCGGLFVLIATTVRRCRDAGISTWFAVLTVLPYVAFIADIVIGLLPSKVVDETVEG